MSLISIIIIICNIKLITYTILVFNVQLSYQKIKFYTLIMKDPILVCLVVSHTLSACDVYLFSSLSIYVHLGTLSTQTSIYKIIIMILMFIFKKTIHYKNIPFLFLISYLSLAL